MSLKRKILILGMSALGVHIILFLLSSFAERKISNDWKQLINFRKMEQVKLLLMGDSHTERSIDAAQLDSTYSLAYFGENNMMNFYKLSYCLKHGMPTPKYILLPCDVVTYSQKFHDYRTNKAFYYSLIPFNEVKNTGGPMLATYYDYVKTRLLPYAEWQHILNRMHVNREKKANLSFANKSPEEQKKDAAFFIRQEIMQDNSVSNLYYENALTYLKRTISLCEEHHIKLIFVKYPLTKRVLDEVKSCIDSASYHNRPAENIIREKHIPILNFETLYTEHPEFFFDCHHINNSGKAAFTATIRQSLDSLYKVY
jgi:hypothetical protein